MFSKVFLSYRLQGKKIRFKIEGKINSNVNRLLMNDSNQRWRCMEWVGVAEMVSFLSMHRYQRSCKIQFVSVHNVWMVVENEMEKELDTVCLTVCIFIIIIVHIIYISLYFGSWTNILSALSSYLFSLLLSIQGRWQKTDKFHALNTKRADVQCL